MTNTRYTSPEDIEAAMDAEIIAERIARRGSIYDRWSGQYGGLDTVSKAHK